MDRIRQQQNRGYLIAGIGAFVALLAFLLLPYTNVIIACSGSCSGITGFSLTLNATFIAQASNQQSSGSSNLLSANLIPFQGQGALWFLPILMLAALALTALLLYRDVPFGKAINASVATQKKWGYYALIGIAALNILTQIILLANLGALVQNVYTSSISSSSSGPFITASADGHLGFFLSLLGMAAVGGAAILMLVQANKLAQPEQALQQMPPQLSQSPSNPYAQQYPTGQQPYQNPTGQHPYQNPYPTTPYPPASYPPQSPYPPAQ